MNDRYGGLCGWVDSTPQFCWMTIDGDDIATNGYQPIPLEPGRHALTCTVTGALTGQDFGFDGIIVTTDASFIPEPYYWLTCTDNAFVAGACPYNWGPNRVPEPPGGRCKSEISPAGDPCSGCPTGVGCQCDAAGSCVDP